MGARIVGAATQFGWTGVELFFVLSGFLITGILLDTRGDRAYLRTFYQRRALRILPLYLLFVWVMVYLIAPRAGAPSDALVARQWWLWTYLANVDIAQHGWYTGVGGPAAHLWSLSIEEQYYLAFPLLVLWLPSAWLARAVVALIAASVVGRAVLALTGHPARMGYVLTFTRLDGLGLGALLAIQARREDGLNHVVHAARVALGLAAATVLALVARTGRFSYADWEILHLGVPAVSIGFAALLTLIVAPAGVPRLRGVFEHASLRYLGVISYSLYIWHPLVGTALRRAGLSQQTLYAKLPSGVLAVVVVMVAQAAVAIVVASVSYRCIERPFLALKERSADRAPRTATELPVP